MTFTQAEQLLVSIFRENRIDYVFNSDYKTFDGIAIISIGAGLGMATLDMFEGTNWVVWVEMSGGKSEKEWCSVYDWLRVLLPKAVVVNGWFTVTKIDYLLSAIRTSGSYATNVLRIAGNGVDSLKDQFVELGCVWLNSLIELQEWIDRIKNKNEYFKKIHYESNVWM